MPEGTNIKKEELRYRQKKEDLKKINMHWKNIRYKEKEKTQIQSKKIKERNKQKEQNRKLKQMYKERKKRANK